MGLTALVVSSQPQLLQKLIPVFDVAGMETEVCTRTSEALERLKQRKFDTVVVDCDGLTDGPQMLGLVPTLGSHRSCVRLALINGATTASQAMKLGASIVLEKNFTQDFLLRTLRTAQGLMLNEQRRYYRHPIDMTVYLSSSDAGLKDVAVMSLNVSTTGMAFKAPLPLGERVRVTVQFQVSGLTVMRTDGEVVWSGPEGRTGITFVRMPKQQQAELAAWLTAEWEKVCPPTQIPRAMTRSEKEKMFGRKLRCNGYINQLPISWKCSDCDWKYSIPLGDSRWNYANHPPEEVEQAFEKHTCDTSQAQTADAPAALSASPEESDQPQVIEFVM